MLNPASPENLTTNPGVIANLKAIPNGELLGIRVEWSIKSKYSNCQFSILRVELILRQTRRVGAHRDIDITDTVADFNNEQLDCNVEYTPRVWAVLSGNIAVDKSDDGIAVFYRGEEHKIMHMLPCAII